MPNPGDYEATFGSAEQQEVDRLTKRVQEREAVIETMAQEKEALRREVATLRAEREAIWNAVRWEASPLAAGVYLAPSLPDAVMALVKAYNARATANTVETCAACVEVAAWQPYT